MRIAFGRLIAVLLPWPSRASRQQAITAARDQKERSRSGAAHAAAIERDITRMAERNHFAGLLAEEIMRQHRGGRR